MTWNILCTKCWLGKDTSQFWSDKRSKSWLRSYCKDCRKIEWTKTGERECISCSILFQYRYKKEFCSIWCRTKWKRDNNLIKYIHTKTCPICNNIFETKKKKQITCSISCSSKHQTIKAIERNWSKKCLICWNDFPFRPWRNRITCSKKCSNINRSNMKYKWPKHSDIMRRENMLCCSICWYNKYPEILERHHIDMNKKNNSIDNLLCLCPNCHCSIHLLTKTWKYYNWSLSAKYLWEHESKSLQELKEELLS